MNQVAFDKWSRLNSWASQLFKIEIFPRILTFKDEKSLKLICAINESFRIYGVFLFFCQKSVLGSEACGLKLQRDIFLTSVINIMRFFSGANISFLSHRTHSQTCIPSYCASKILLPNTYLLDTKLSSFSHNAIDPSHNKSLLSMHSPGKLSRWNSDHISSRDHLAQVIIQRSSQIPTFLKVGFRA